MQRTNQYVIPLFFFNGNVLITLHFWSVGLKWAEGGLAPFWLILLQLSRRRYQRWKLFWTMNKCIHYNEMHFFFFFAFWLDYYNFNKIQMYTLKSFISYTYWKKIFVILFLIEVICTVRSDVFINLSIILEIESRVYWNWCKTSRI